MTTDGTISDETMDAIFGDGTAASLNRIPEGHHRCAACQRVLPEATDQTDPADDETTLDSAGIVARNDWVCGECLDKVPARLLCRVRVWRSGPGGAYGQAMDLDEVCWELREEIAAAVMEGRGSGDVSVGGQAYRWNTP